jgi:hypothetical protein
MALPIAPGSTATAFADGEFTVLAGAPAYLIITNPTDGAGIPGDVNFEIAFKTADNEYTVYWMLNANNVHELGGIAVPGTWAARRIASATGSAGLEKKS